MKVSEVSYKQLNNLVTLCFDANAVFDNLSYNLDYHYYIKIAHVLHLSIAHVMPEWADEISDKMLELGLRPTREEIKAHIEEYEDVKGIFEVAYNTFLSLRASCCELISTADLNYDDEVRIFGEGFLEKISPFIKQIEEWIHALGKMDANELNIHINDYTNFIKVRD